jgi:hypothetical protein
MFNVKYFLPLAQIGSGCQAFLTGTNNDDTIIYIIIPLFYLREAKETRRDKCVQTTGLIPVSLFRQYKTGTVFKYYKPPTTRGVIIGYGYTAKEYIGIHLSSRTVEFLRNTSEKNMNKKRINLISFLLPPRTT